MNDLRYLNIQMFINLLNSLLLNRIRYFFDDDLKNIYKNFS